MVHVFVLFKEHRHVDSLDNLIDGSKISETQTLRLHIMPLIKMKDRIDQRLRY